MDCFDHQTCLGIPVPVSVRALARTPPICLPAPADHETIEILGNLGRKLYRPQDEIKQAQNLAAGLSDIVIILERPRDRKNHNFNVDFDKFVRTCNTLWAVDELIRFATRGARSIHTTTILDAFSYQPDKKVMEQDQECHAALARILKAKRPKVILRCHREDYKDEWLKCIEQQGVDYEWKRKEINITENDRTVVLQSFHPSCAVNNADCRPEYRALLVYHFVATFSELRSEFKLPETAKKIEKLCALRGERKPRDIYNYERWQAATRISQMLEEKYKGPCENRFFRVDDETAHQHRRNQIEAFEGMYASLKQLFGESKEPGGLAIAKNVLFLWKKHFHKNPLYQHIMSWLLLCGNKQKDWLPCGTSLASAPGQLEERFSGILISESTLLTDIKTTNREGKVLALEASKIFILEEHNTLIREYLSRTTMSDINNAMHISALLSQCEVFLPALEEDDALEQGEFDGLVQGLEQLASFFNSNNAL
ncbi:hypothetical protein BJX66DRAFT_332779 [Aspergillus keveii]|uniref:Uncharacterized protein n=1 Tax=Aspergillus keveii TaxID=714993 RepID=A0ABR4GKZ3_9EURO